MTSLHQISGTGFGRAAQRGTFKTWMGRPCRSTLHGWSAAFFLLAFVAIMQGVMSFSLVFTPYNIPPFAPKQARQSKLENVTPVKNEPNANVCSPSQISIAISHGSCFSVADGRRGCATEKSIRQSHVIARNHPRVRIPSVGSDRRRNCVSGYSGGSVYKKKCMYYANERNHLQPLKH